MLGPLSNVFSKRTSPGADDGDIQDTQTNDDRIHAAQNMHALIDLQTFSGAWSWNAELFSILGVSESNGNKEALGVETVAEPEIGATALAIAFLESRVPGKKDVWEMIVSKAREWLEQKVGGAKRVDEIVQKAKEVLA